MKRRKERESDSEGGGAEGENHTSILDIRYEDRSLSTMLTGLAAHLLLDSAGYTILSDKEIVLGLMKGCLLWANVLGLRRPRSPPVLSPRQV